MDEIIVSSDDQDIDVDDGQTIVINGADDPITIVESSEQILIDDGADPLFIDDATEQINIADDVEVIVISDVGIQGAKGDKGDKGDSGAALTLEAGQNIIAYKLITTDQDGRAIHASADNISHCNRIAGIATQSASVRANVAVMEVGTVTNDGWNWTQGALLYLGLNGDVTTQQVGTFSALIGYAVKHDTIKLNLGINILRA